MRPFRTLPLMVSLCVCCIVWLIPARSLAQCTLATTRHITYDTVFTGTGNDYFNPVIPQFDPSLGDLVAVVIKSNISIGYSFQVENLQGGPRSVTIGVGRNDYIGNDNLPSGYIMNFYQRNYGPYILGPANGVPNSGSDYVAKGPFSFLDQYTVLNDSITGAVSGFMGTGTMSSMSFDYFPTTYSIVPSGLNYSFYANDTMRFSVSYYYCNASILPNGFTGFTATRADDATVLLNWTVENETKGTQYVIEESANGSLFLPAGTQMAAATGTGNNGYHHSYTIGEQESGTLYFRIKSINSDGTVRYSETRTIDLGAGRTGSSTGRLYLYPNPTVDYINLVFKSPGRSWQVDILSAEGKLLQRNVFLNAGSARIDFRYQLAKGTYFVRVTDQESRQSEVSGFIVR